MIGDPILQRYIFNCSRKTSIWVQIQNLSLPKSNLSWLTTIIQKDATSTPIAHGKGASHMDIMKKNLEG